MGQRLYPGGLPTGATLMEGRPYLPSVMVSEITCHHIRFLACHTCHQFSPPGTPGLACHPPAGAVSATKGEPHGLFGSDRVGTEGITPVNSFPGEGGHEHRKNWSASYLWPDPALGHSSSHLLGNVTGSSPMFFHPCLQLCKQVNDADALGRVFGPEYILQCCRGTMRQADMGILAKTVREKLH